ncbi:MAG: hypothetical protein AAF447_17945 [Myxococcota bacterium]
MRHVGTASLVAFVILAPALAACFDTDFGASHGRYDVEAALVESSCGQGYTTPDTADFAVELFSGEFDVVWRVGDGQPLRGEEREDGAWEFVQEASVAVSTPDGQATDCVLLQRETLVLEGVPEALPEDGQSPFEPGDVAFEGTSVVEISPLAGADCRVVLAAFGGAFSALPCTVDFTLEGAAR